MATLEWQLRDAHESGVASLSLPLTGDAARSLLRGQTPASPLKAAITEPGRLADLLGLGWASLYALSPNLSAAVANWPGVSLTAVGIAGGPNGYQALGVTGRCGAVDYEKSSEVRRIGRFVRLRGLHVDEPTEAVDFAVPANRETILISSRAADLIVRTGFNNVRIVPLDAVEFDVDPQTI